jgi:hypothetical protein
MISLDAFHHTSNCRYQEEVIPEEEKEVAGVPLRGSDRLIKELVDMKVLVKQNSHCEPFGRLRVNSAAQSSLQNQRKDLKRGSPRLAWLGSR